MGNIVTNYNNIKILMFMTFFTLIFDNIPSYLQLSAISSGLSNKISWYFFILLTIIYSFFRKKGNIVSNKYDYIIRLYICVLICMGIISMIYGIIIFPYYEDINSHTVLIDKKYTYIEQILTAVGLKFWSNYLPAMALIFRGVKNSILVVFFTYGFAYILYNFIKKDWKGSFLILINAVNFSSILLFFYSFFEVLYLSGNGWGTKILQTITPFFHSIATAHNWWPPLLWQNQLRSVFSEPSRVGNYAAFLLPLLWGQFLLLSDKRKRIVLYIIVFSFMVFLTQARTAVFLLLGLIILFFILIIWSKEYKLFKKYFYILLMTGVSFFISLGFINSVMGRYSENPNINTSISINTESNGSNNVNSNTDTNINSQSTIMQVEQYVDNNVKSLSSTDQRSNRARYALLKSHFKLFCTHPLVGVGDGFSTAYIVKLFDENDIQSEEVKMWISNYQKEGILKYNFDAMNEFVTRLATNGIIGTGIYIWPFAYGVYCLLRRLRHSTYENKNILIILLLSFCGTWVAGMNGSLTILYTHWVILAFVYAYIWQEKY